MCQDHAVTTALCCRWGGMLYEAVISQYVQSGVAYWVGPGYWMRWHVLSIYTRWRSRMSQLASAGPHFGYLIYFRSARNSDKSLDGWKDWHSAWSMTVEAPSTMRRARWFVPEKLGRLGDSEPCRLSWE